MQETRDRFFQGALVSAIAIQNCSCNFHIGHRSNGENIFLSIIPLRIASSLLNVISPSTKAVETRVLSKQTHQDFGMLFVLVVNCVSKISVLGLRKSIFFIQNIKNTDFGHFNQI